ncbi:diguanylate cyclase [Iamia sp. SCSIO 61187]|uniref:GGDEF domain-containing protein n=1 Tax=Iamia sp. SCSIO 61187 TaxID=2722752 RepID=UPI001C62AA69|nr:GGDEF domain-containing protein [Iamia sp. SCSIO 61187]QYG93864.1 diguanylate cyclase [Iamia sp. SCSIO 61187]
MAPTSSTTRTNTRPWEPESTRASRQRRVLPFLALVAAALVVVALPPGEPGRFGAIALAFLGFAGCGALIVFVPWERLPDWPRLGIVAIYCTNVGLVRDATGGGRSGFLFMLLLVVMWQAAYGSRPQIAVTLVMSVLTAIVPIVTVGGDEYPGSEWRKALMFSLVAAVIGIVVHELVRRTTQERWAVDRVARLGRAAAHHDSRSDVCQLALELTGADLAVLLEPAERGITVTASAGRAVPLVTLTADLVPPAVRRALESARTQVILDVDADGATRGGVSAALGVRAWVHQPGISPGGRATIDLAVGWAEPRRRVPALASYSLPLLADEAAAIVDRAELVERLETMTRQDPLTGLLNRRGWDDHLTRELARAARTGRPLSVAVLDLDRFKRFNDAHGHLVGDQLLKAATSAWTGALRTSDVLARWGGEEFAVLMPETGTEDAISVISRMARRTPMEQTFSAGIVTVDAGVDPDALMVAADDAVYVAKDRGRDRIEIGTAPPPVEPTGAASTVDLT